VELSGSYPGWTPNAESEILDVLVLFTKNKLERNRVVACHRIRMRHSWTHPGNGYDFFGPTIQGPHSPDERASISSSQKILEILMEVLENIPLNNIQVLKKEVNSVIVFVTLAEHFF
jgi:dipeptidase D